MKHHDLKCFTGQYANIISGKQRSMVRYDDRKYSSGDTVTLKEGNQDIDGFMYTGREMSARISHIDDFGCQPGYLNLSLSDVGLLIAEEV